MLDRSRCRLQHQLHRQRHNEHHRQIWYATVVITEQSSITLDRGRLIAQWIPAVAKDIFVWIVRPWPSVKKLKSFPSLKGPWGSADTPFISPQPDTSRSRKTTNTGLVHRVVCPFTPQLSLVLINRPRRDDTLSWRWYAAAVGGIRTHNLAVASPAPYHSATQCELF